MVLASKIILSESLSTFCCILVAPFVYDYKTSFMLPSNTKAPITAAMTKFISFHISYIYSIE
jgi:hypothetical protein